MFAVGVSVVDLLIDLNPTERDAVINAALIGSVAWGFYRIGKNGG